MLLVSVSVFLEPLYVQGNFLKRNGNWLNDMGYRRDFTSHFFVLEDGTLRYWRNELHRQQSPHRSSGPYLS